MITDDQLERETGPRRLQMQLPQNNLGHPCFHG
jgi:hypothetical protein